MLCGIDEWHRYLGWNLPNLRQIAETKHSESTWYQCKEQKREKKKVMEKEKWLKNQTMIIVANQYSWLWSSSHSSQPERHVDDFTHIVILSIIELILRYLWLIRLYYYVFVELVCNSVSFKCDRYWYYNVDDAICTRWYYALLIIPLYWSHF